RNGRRILEAELVLRVEILLEGRQIDGAGRGVGERLGDGFLHIGSADRRGLRGGRRRQRHRNERGGGDEEPRDVGATMCERTYCERSHRTLLFLVAVSVTPDCVRLPTPRWCRHEIVRFITRAKSVPASVH